MRDADPIGESDALAAHDVFAVYLNNVAGIELLAGASRVLLTGSGGVKRSAQYLLGNAQTGSGARFYSSVAIVEFDGQGDQSWWRPIPAMRDVGEIHGANLCGDYWIVLSSTTTAAQKRLELWRQALTPINAPVEDLLTATVPWEGPFALKLPATVNAFDAVTMRVAESGAPPLVIIEADERTIYTRPLGLDGTGWTGRFRSSANTVLWRELGQTDPYAIHAINDATMACRHQGQTDVVLTDAVIAADVDGDGADEIVAFPDGTGFWAMKLYAVGPRATWLSLGDRPNSQRLDCNIRPPSAFLMYKVASGDFDGDRRRRNCGRNGCARAAEQPLSHHMVGHLRPEVEPGEPKLGGAGQCGKCRDRLQFWFPTALADLKQCLVGRFTQEQTDELLLCFSDGFVTPYLTHFLVYRLVNGTWKEVSSAGSRLDIGAASLWGQVVVVGNFLGNRARSSWCPRLTPVMCRTAAAGR